MLTKTVSYFQSQILFQLREIIRSILIIGR